MTIEILLVVYCFAIVLASTAGGRLPRLVNMTHLKTQLLMSFVGGLMLGIALLHLMPHAVDTLGSASKAGVAALVGVVTMFLLMRAFHPPHDPDKVVINEEENKYFSFKGFQGFNSSSFRLSNSTTFEIVDKEIDEYFDDAKRTSNQGFHVPDLLISTDLNNETDAPIRQNKVMYRKPSKYIRPKLFM